MRDLKGHLLCILFISLIVLMRCDLEPVRVVHSTDGVEIHFDVQGRGDPPLVFVHGFASHRVDWKDQMRYFSQNHKVVAIDLAGFGESGNNRESWTMGGFGEDVVSVIKHLNMKKVILVGQSMGTAVVLEAAKRIPERMMGIVPVDMLQNIESKRTEEQNEQFEERVWDHIINATEESLRSAFKKEIDSTVIQEMIHFYQSSSKIGWRESGRAFLSWMSNDLIRVLMETQAPIYCINSDRMKTDVEIARKYVDSFNVKIMKGVGHAVMLEDPDEFNRLLEEIVVTFQNQPYTSQEKEVDFSQAELMLDFFRDLAKGKLHPEKVDEIMDSKGTELIVGQLNLARRATKSQYKQLLMGLLTDEVPDVPPADDSERAKWGIRGLKQIWDILRWGMNNAELLEKRIDFLKQFEIFSRARQIAEGNLPVPLEAVPNLFVVAGGRAGAAAIGNDIYIDVLNFTRSRSKPGRSYLSKSEAIEIFAHETHHVGFRTIKERKRNDLHLDENMDRTFGFLTGLVSEGSASYLINGHRDIEAMRDNRNYKPYFAMGDTLMMLCENVLSSTLDGEIRNDEEFDRVTTRMLGSGYHVAGSILFSIIDKVNGLDPIMAVMADPRRFLVEYNRAAKGLTSNTNSVYTFDSDLVRSLSTMGH